jgi:hypothetical protein
MFYSGFGGLDSFLVGTQKYCGGFKPLYPTNKNIGASVPVRNRRGYWGYLWLVLLSRFAILFFLRRTGVLDC